MKIVACDLYRYRLPLTPPLPVGDRTVAYREGALVRLGSDTDHTGWGDAAPLPGFSPETVEEALAQLRETRRRLIGRNVSAQESLLDVLATLPIGRETLPSVRFALELALANLVAGARGKALPTLFSESPRPTVSINALLNGPPDVVRAEAERARGVGYRALKLKVGRHGLRDEIALVRALHETIGNGTTLRLDANRAWSFEEAVAFAEGIGDIPVAYIEEPLADPTRLPALAEATGLPIALDETARAISSDAVGNHRYAAALVLKPSLAGGITGTLRLAQCGSEYGLIAVISAAYESGVGLAGLVALAASIGTDDVPAGLDTYRRLDADVLDTRLALDVPSLDVNRAVEAARSVDRAMLDAA